MYIYILLIVLFIFVIIIIQEQPIEYFNNIDTTISLLQQKYYDENYDKYYDNGYPKKSSVKNFDKCFNFKNINQCMTECDKDSNCKNFTVYKKIKTCCLNTEPIKNDVFFIKNNDRYIGNINRVKCKELCPKCIIGRCPRSYRCKDMTSDPRYVNSCILKNNEMYDEKKNIFLDNSRIPYLDKIYELY